MTKLQQYGLDKLDRDELFDIRDEIEMACDTVGTTDDQLPSLPSGNSVMDVFLLRHRGSSEPRRRCYWHFALAPP